MITNLIFISRYLSHYHSFLNLKTKKIVPNKYWVVFKGHDCRIISIVIFLIYPYFLMKNTNIPLRIICTYRSIRKMIFFMKLFNYKSVNKNFSQRILHWKTKLTEAKSILGQFHPIMPPYLHLRLNLLVEIRFKVLQQFR